MTDHEMIELAAKAVGLEYQLYEDDQPIRDITGRYLLPFSIGWWSPLYDDGDALRLAVKLKIDPMFDITTHIGEPAIGATYPANGDFANVVERIGSDPFAAARRAITRAAAAIGEAMKP